MNVDGPEVEEHELLGGVGGYQLSEACEDRDLPVVNKLWSLLPSSEAPPLSHPLRHRHRNDIEVA